MSSPDALVISGLTIKRGGRQVVHGVDITAQPGVITSLLGPNGAGKSTLVLALAGVLRPAEGSVVLAGKDITGRSPAEIRAAGLATVPEGHRVLKDLTVADNLRVASLLSPAAGRREGLDRVHSLFEELSPLGSRMAGSLSGGQQQMLAIAQALVHQPRFLVIDEMSLGLAPIVVRRLIPTLRRIAEDGVGVLLIEQFTQVALGLSTEAFALAQGRVVLEAQSADLLAEPRLLEQAYRLR